MSYLGCGHLQQGLKKKAKVYNMVIVASVFGTVSIAHKDVTGDEGEYIGLGLKWAHVTALCNGEQGPVLDQKGTWQGFSITMLQSE